MKYALTILSLFANVALYSQWTYLRYDVFQFNLGDEFQYYESHGAGSSSYNRLRESYTVIGIAYNSDSTSVTYTYSVEGADSWITSDYNWSTSFFKDTVSEFYDGLNLTLSEYDTLFYPYFDSVNNGPWVDTFSRKEPRLCDSLIQGRFLVTSTFEGQFYETGYGLGLGCVINDHVDGSNPQNGGSYHYRSLLGFVKNGDTCGSVVSTTLTLPESSIPDLQIYPNPCSSQLTLRGIQQPADFSILSANGEVVLDGQLGQLGQLNQEQNRISVSELKNGLYILQIETAEGVRVEKFIVEK